MATAQELVESLKQTALRLDRLLPQLEKRPQAFHEPFEDLMGSMQEDLDKLSEAVLEFLPAAVDEERERLREGASFLEHAE